MSVVNKMLKDLENRQSQSTAFSADYQPPAKDSKKNAMILISLLVLALSIIVFSPVFNKPDFAGDISAPPRPEQPQVIQSETPSLPLDFNEVKQPQPDQQDASIAVNLASAATELEKSPAQPLPEPVEIELPELAVEQQLRSNDETLVAVNVDNTEVKSTEHTSFEVSTNEVKDEAELFRQQAQSALQKGDDKKAIDALSQLVNLQPDNNVARKKLAALMFADGQHERAKRYLQQGLENDPSRSDMRLMLGRLYAQQNQPQLAFELLSEEQTFPLQDSDYLAFRASIARSIGQLKFARQDYLDLLKIEPNSPQWWLGLAICEDTLGAFSDALQAYRKVYSLDPISPQVAEFVAQRIATLAGVK